MHKVAMIWWQCDILKFWFLSSQVNWCNWCGWNWIDIMIFTLSLFLIVLCANNIVQCMRQQWCIDMNVLEWEGGSVAANGHINDTMVLLWTQCKVWYGEPNQAGCDDAKSLLTTAHPYLVAVCGAAEQDNILETTKMAEKYDAQKLMEICVDFIHVNIIVLDYAGVLWELLLVLFLARNPFFG